MWAVDGLANFLPYAVIPLALLMPAALIVRRRVVTLLVALPLLVWVALMATPNAFLAIAQDVPPGAPQLRVVTANVLMSNGSLAALADDVMAQAPDVVVFEELRHDLADFSPALAAAYPFRISTATPWVTIASRLPLEDARRMDVAGDDRGRDLLSAAIELEGQRITLIAGHLMPPLNREAFEINRQQHAVLNAEIREASGPLVVVGDFNATTLSPTFAGFLWSTGLRIAASDRSLDPTYFAYGRLGVRIDHVLVRDADVGDEHVFTLTGSDHRGVSVNIAVPPGRAAETAASR